MNILKKGVADSLQDAGRYGFQSIGIPPCGFMDYLSAQLANLILGNPIHQTVFELHFPASSISFEEDICICITGANFVPVVNEKSIQLYTPVYIKAKDQLKFLQPLYGKICYIAIKGKVNSPTWLNSQSYFLERIQTDNTFLIEKNNTPLPVVQSVWINTIHKHIFHPSPIRFIPGPAWNDLEETSIQALLKKSFSTSIKSNRMGYKIQGEPLSLQGGPNYLSSAVTKGTMQLLPSGEIIVLMADHQTIGGYANIGQIILVDLPKLAQMKNDVPFHWAVVSVELAQQSYLEIQNEFHQYDKNH